MNSTMQDVPLSITALFRRGADVFPIARSLRSKASAPGTRATMVANA